MKLERFLVCFYSFFQLDISDGGRGVDLEFFCTRFWINDFVHCIECCERCLYTNQLTPYRGNEDQSYHDIYSPCNVTDPLFASFVDVWIEGPTMMNHQRRDRRGY